MWVSSRLSELLRSQREVAGALALVLALAAGPSLLERALLELSVLRTQLGLLALTDGGRALSWPRVQFELRQLLLLERNRRLAGGALGKKR